MPELLYPFNHIPIAKLEWPEHDFNQTKLISFIKDFDRNNKIPEDQIVADRIKHNLSESSPHLDFFDKADIPAIRDLSLFIEDAILDLYHDLWQFQQGTHDSIEVKANIVESWYHITRYGGYHDYHDHHTSWSGIYFLDVKECHTKNGSMRFYKPFSTSQKIEGDVGLSWASNDTIELLPSSGEVLFFPGFLPHAALPYFGKSHRIAIAFNITITKC